MVIFSRLVPTGLSRRIAAFSSPARLTPSNLLVRRHQPVQAALKYSTQSQAPFPPPSSRLIWLGVLAGASALTLGWYLNQPRLHGESRRSLALTGPASSASDSLGTKADTRPSSEGAATVPANAPSSQVAAAASAAPSAPTPVPSLNSVKPGLPFYTADQVAQHDSKATGIWVISGDGVYDITNFVDIHPGGERIFLAAGKSIDPFWNVFTIHQSPETRALLEEYRIGNVDPNHRRSSDDDAKALQLLFANDPERSPELIVRAAKPCNAETPVHGLRSFVTPTDLHYVRNHLPVPKIDVDDFRIKIEGPGIPDDYSVSLDDIKRIGKEVELTVTLECAGNRRKDMHDTKPTKGLLWTQGAISNAVYTGVRLRDVLIAAGFDPTSPDAQEVEHVQFTGAEGYGSSIPLNKALSPMGDVILAYKMNGEDLPSDHGYPLRSIVPGHVAARSVKWLNGIVLSDEESPSHWQRRDYKGFGPSKTLETSDYEKAESIQEMPVQSAITFPLMNQLVSLDPPSQDSGRAKTPIQGTVRVEGYAWSGGGRSIARVDVSSDGGKTWIDAELLEGHKQQTGRHWAWVQWRADVPVGKLDSTADDSQRQVELVCKAIDSSYNTQPETHDSCYNVRGVLVSAWHRVSVLVA
ncbi:Oxidoreductase, molybdopterin-binding domain-containing protein [Polychytrium aggregatum]|uniref:Oxidoreductase, molybdopterin-binding domain-containing protein n=1 Tax=Polychytrium aggregatum TaxID=110093 RepID=UPI0022FE7CDC|nr:Oxidoreductase, molybdopterin-binding domain-containing protein [Polychytrium aggregatum]KAI9206095.1 Oxidoreductase, molybdopterin-binding domain-containing protein [Polychytrium aggregatum]